MTKWRCKLHAVLYIWWDIETQSY